MEKDDSMAQKSLISVHFFKSQKLFRVCVLLSNTDYDNFIRMTTDITDSRKIFSFYLILNVLHVLHLPKSNA